MAFAAVISLKQTIHRLLNSSHTPIPSSSREILEFASTEITSLQEFLKEFYQSNSNRWNALNAKIREAVQKAEDAIESNQFLSLPEESRQDIHSLIETMTIIKKDFTQNHPPLDDDEEEEDDDDAAVSTYNDLGSEMIGLSNELAEMKEDLLKPLRPYDFGVYSHVGKIGSLRSITVKALFDDIFVAKEEPFDCGAWVTVGRNYQITEILTNIIAQVDDQARIDHHNMEKLGTDLYDRLKGRRYMIVLDDVDDVEVWDELKNSFPEQDNGSLIVLTTGLIEVAQFAKSFYIHEMPMLFGDFFWDYLRMLMFGCKKEIDPEMERAGKKIAENCRGSRIALARVILFLCKFDMTPDHESWTKLAADEQHPIFVVHDEVLEVPSPTYFRFLSHNLCS